MPSRIITFYSFKGGVGRSFALANVAVILAQWGYRVLAVDWDIEAPGLNHYFARHSKPANAGVLDFLVDCKEDRRRRSKEYVVPVALPHALGQLHIMPAAAASGADYARVVQTINWDNLFESHDLGARIESLRADWQKDYDIVLIDSRTGVTDFSGITTVQLPDILVFLFTANNQSLDGSKDIVNRAMKARNALPFDRPAFQAVPLPARFDNREEYDRARHWRGRFAEDLHDFYSAWVPEGTDILRIVDLLSIPYVPRWTFGEDLCALLEPPSKSGLRSPSTPISFALETLAALLARSLDRIDLLQDSRDEYVLAARRQAPATVSRRDGKIRVFISYARESEGLAERLSETLREFGADPFGAFSLSPAASWRSEIADAIENADVVIPIFGGSDSRAQAIELEHAIRSSLRSDGTATIVPVVQKNGKSAFLRSPVANYQAIFLDDTRGESSQLSPLIRLLVDRSTAKEFAGARNSWSESSGLPDEALPTLGRAEVLEQQVNRYRELARRDVDKYGQYLASSLSDLAALLSASGDYQQAAEFHSQLLECRQALVNIDPNNEGRLRDLAVAHQKVGDGLAELGELPSALDAFQASLAIYERLAKEAPGAAVQQRDLSVSYNKIGDVLRTQGNLAAALDAFNASLAIVDRLAKADPGNAGWQRDLSVSYNKIGDVLRAQGNLPSALDAFNASLAIAERLARTDSRNAGWQRDLSVSHDRIGDVLVGQGNLPAALAAFNASLAIADRLAKADPGNAGWQRDLSVSYDRIGDVLVEQSNLPAALDAFNASLVIRERLANADPGNAVWQRDLARCLGRIATVDAQRGERTRALNAIARGREIIERLRAASPSNATLARDLAWFDGQIAQLK